MRGVFRLSGDLLMTTDTPANDLPWTGERYLPQIGGEIELEHVHRYLWAEQFAHGKSVLDIACGEGFGSEILASSATQVVGVNLSEDAVVHALRKYRRKNLKFQVGSCDQIPVPDSSIDLVVSFETIENRNRHQEMMREIKRVLHPEGILIISSPDNHVYSDIPSYKDDHHVKELFAPEFEALLKEHFANVQMFGQRVAYGSLIGAEGLTEFVSFDSEQKAALPSRGIGRAMYNVAIASDCLLPRTFSSIYEGSMAKSACCQALQREIELRGSKLTELQEQMQRRSFELENVRRLNEELRRESGERQRHLMLSAESIHGLHAEIEHLKITRFEAKRECHSVKTSLSWRVTWPLRLARDRFASVVWHARRGFSKGSADAPVTLEDPGRTAIGALFDENYYTSLNPEAADSGRSPIEHYLEKGWREGFKPHPLFDPGWYLRENPEVAEAGMEPLYHYVKYGWREGRSPHPLFDVRYYRKQAKELVEKGIEPITHFVEHGARVGLKPNPLFDPLWYACFHHDSLSPGENPLIHYVTRGGKEGCDPSPSFSLFLYLKANPGVRNEDPLSHYLRHSRSDPPNLMPDIRTEPPGADSEPPEVDVKAIALYLPQFHCIRENDAWWGEGFTEWTNVRRGRPQFWGHYQPHVPHPDIGYYDLTDPSVMEKQAQMARQFGIYGFCFYYYWFNGRRLLEMPTDRLLASGKPDFPFCFCWANENWTRRWDGREQEVLTGQQHSRISDDRFIRDMLPAFRDRRYIRINGRPLLTIYRPGLLPDPKTTFAHWREVCRNEGIGEIYLAGFKGFGFETPEPFGMDALVEFPPVDCEISRSRRWEFPVFNTFEGAIYDYRKFVSNLPKHSTGNFTLFRGVMPSWDNTARRQEKGTIFAHSDPQLYCRWLHRAVLQARHHPNLDERLIFINSWNEWAEGAHLEPDDRYGYAWLDATRLALECGNASQISGVKSTEPSVHARVT